MSLADKIRASRKVVVTIGEIKFMGRRATAEEFARYMSAQTLDAEVARYHIYDWEGVKESDLIDGGSKDMVKFDRELFAEIIGDKPEWFGEIAKVVLADALERLKGRIENEKK